MLQITGQAIVLQAVAEDQVQRPAAKGVAASDSRSGSIINGTPLARNRSAYLLAGNTGRPDRSAPARAQLRRLRIRVTAG
jgi:hypothetical protein